MLAYGSALFFKTVQWLNMHQPVQPFDPRMINIGRATHGWLPATLCRLPATAVGRSVSLPVGNIWSCRLIHSACIVGANQPILRAGRSRQGILPPALIEFGTSHFISNS